MEDHTVESTPLPPICVPSRVYTDVLPHLSGDQFKVFFTLLAEMFTAFPTDPGKIKRGWVDMVDEYLSEKCGLTSTVLVPVIQSLIDLHLVDVQFLWPDTWQYTIAPTCWWMTKGPPQPLPAAAPPYLERRSSRLMRIFAQRFHLTCVYCKRVGTEDHDPDGAAWHRDHVWPHTQGGSQGGNLVLACRSCNTRKHTLAATDFLAKLAAEGVIKAQE